MTEATCRLIYWLEEWLVAGEAQASNDDCPIFYQSKSLKRKREGQQEPCLSSLEAEVSKLFAFFQTLQE